MYKSNSGSDNFVYHHEKGVNYKKFPDVSFLLSIEKRVHVIWVIFKRIFNYSISNKTPQEFPNRVPDNEHIQSDYAISKGDDPGKENGWHGTCVAGKAVSISKRAHAACPSMGKFWKFSNVSGVMRH